MWESYNILILKREIFIVSSPPLSHCHALRGVFTQTKHTPIQSVESILELGKHWVFAKLSR